MAKTISISDGLHQRLKIEAARQGVKLQELIERELKINFEKAGK